MRAFVAVEITEPAILQNIRVLQSEIWKEGARPVDADKLHFTLQFLGEIPDDPQPVIDAVSSVRFAGFDLEIGELGAFPNGRSPRIIWVGARDAGVVQGRDADGGRLTELARQVAEALRPLNYAPDKRFVAHSTVFRVKRGNVSFTGEIEDRAGTVFGIQRVSRFKLKESRLTPRGPIYTDLAEVGETG